MTPQPRRKNDRPRAKTTGREPTDWLSRLRHAITYGRDSEMFRSVARSAEADGFKVPAKLAGGARRTRPARPARDALIVAHEGSDREVAEWWRMEVVQKFATVAKDEAGSLASLAIRGRREHVAAYREWLGVVAASVRDIYIGDYREPRLERQWTVDGKWNRRYWLLLPKDHLAVNDDAVRRRLLIDLAMDEADDWSSDSLPDARMTRRAVALIRKRHAKRTG